MRHSMLSAVLFGAVTLAASSLAVAQSRPDYGKIEYQSNRAVCHGETGEGGGPYVSFINKTPPDLTTLSKRAMLGQRSSCSVLTCEKRAYTWFKKSRCSSPPW